MHEQSIVESLLALALKNAERAGAARIVRINLVVGPLSGVVEESVDLYFGFLSKNTIAAEASINYKHMPAKFRCRDCRSVFVDDTMKLRCPDCSETNVEIIGGRELYIESLEVE